MIRLKELRRNARLSQERLGKVLNVAGNTIGQYECGKREPNLEILIKIADYFDVSIDYLVGRCDAKIQTPTELKLTPEQKLLIEETEDLSKVETLQVITYIYAMKELYKQVDSDYIEKIKNVY